MSDSNISLSESSTKEEVGEYFFRLIQKEDVKNILINEYISGDVLISLSLDEIKSLGIKFGPARRIFKFIEENRDKFKEKEINEKLYANSNQEEVKEFFEKCLDFKGELNSLDGKGLLELNNEGMKALGLKFGQIKKLIKYINYFKTLKPPVIEEISISRSSSEEEVTKFLKMRLKFSQESIDKLGGIDGETFYDLKENEIDNLNEISQEEKESLKNFLKEEKTKSEKEDNKIEQEEIKLERSCNTEALCQFLKKKLQLSDETIEYIKSEEFDGESFLTLPDEDIKSFEGISESEKEKIIVFLKEFNTEKEKSELKIDNKSSKEDIVKFLKDKLNFSDNTLKDWKEDGKTLFSLTETDIDKLTKITTEEKDKLKKFLKEKKSSSQPQTVEINLIKEEDNKRKEEENKKKEEENKKKEEENKKKEEENKKKEDKIEKEPKDGKKKDIKQDKKEDKEDQKDKKKEGEKKDEIKISKESKKEDIIKFLEKYNLKLENLTNKELEKINEIENEEKEIIKNFLIKKEDQPKRNIDNNIDEKPKLKRATKMEDVLVYPKKENLNPKTTIKKRDKNDNQKEIKKSVKDDNDMVIENQNLPLLNQIIDQKTDAPKFHSFSKAKITQLQNAPYNIFFYITLSDLQSKSAGYATYVDEGGYFNSSYYNYNSVLISKNVYENDKGGQNYFYIFQIPLEKPLKKFTISIKKSKTKNAHQYNSIIETNSIENYFNVYNLKFDYFEDNFPNVDINSAFSEYLDYFWNKNDIQGEKLNKSLIKAIMNRISRENKIKIRPHNFFRIIKLCGKFGIEMKNLEYLEIKAKKKVAREYYLTSEDIDKINTKKRAQIIDLIVFSFIKIDINYLIELTKGNSGPDICRSILDNINKGEIKIENFKLNKEDFTIFQKLLLSITKTKDEVEYVITLSKQLIPSLKFIQDNIDVLQTLQSYCFPINLDAPNDKDNIDDIIILVNDIFNKCAEKKIKIFNIEELLENLINFTYYKDSLDDICKLHNFVQFVTKDRKGQNLVVNLYKKIHEKGMNLIINNKLKTDDIFTFIMKQDVYYFKQFYSKSEFRDPEIFKYIPIVKKNKVDIEYLKNIAMIRTNRLFDLFAGSNTNVQKKFQEILLNQMKTMSDLKAIFDIFPMKNIDQSFTFLINKKVDELKFTILDEPKENEDVLFDIYDNWLLVNFDNRLDLKYNVNILEENYDFTSKYYFHLFKSKNMQLVVNMIRGYIINFFLGQNIQQRNSPESLIFLLLNSYNDQLCLYVLDQMNKLIMTKEDFYQKEENQRFQLFKLFFEKCGDLYKNPNIAEGKYLQETLRVRYSIITEIKYHNLRYELITNLIDEPSFYRKLEVLLNNEGNDPKIVFVELKKDIEICRNKFDEVEKINDYFNSFFSNSRKNEIDLINRKLLELKKKKVSEIIKIDKFFDENELENFDDLIEESKNLKYKDSSFFMVIYNTKKNNESLEKTEKQIFDDSIDEYKKTCKEIIEQKESKKPFFEINNVNEILKETQNPSNDMNKEIKFMAEEFADLGKNDYIKNNLLNDLNNFANKDKISKLLQSIIYFIESIDKIKNIKKTEFLDRFEQIYDSINSSEVSGEDIKFALDLLKKYDYDIKNETTLTKFYELLLGKEDAVTFIKTIKDSNLEIRNLNEFIDESETSELQTSDIDNLITVYSFFEKLMEDKNIKTDEDLLKIFKEYFYKEKQIEIKLQNYLNSYGEIIQLFESYGENPEMTIQKIGSLLRESTLYLYKDVKTDLFTFKLEYENKNGNKVEQSEAQLEELRNKLLLSSSTSNNNENKEKENNDILNKSELSKKYIKLIENLNKLVKTLNSLLKAGYPDLNGFTIEIKDSEAYNQRENLNLKNLMNSYKKKNKNFRDSIKNGFQNFPLLRLFYGKQFIQLYENVKNKNMDISHLINSVTLNQIKNTKIDYEYNGNKTLLENINSFLEKMFRTNNINLPEIYRKNQVLPENELSPGLYRKTKSGQSSSSDLINNILNIYLNLTGNVPIINTLLICNEDTSTEQIRAFLYRAFYCEIPALFLICNMECLDLSATTNLIKTLKELYKLKKGRINSYLLFIYEKVNSGLVRDLEKLIPEKNILNDSYLSKSESKNKAFDNVEVFASKFSGFGKTTEIFYKVKECKGDYRYLPIGGTINRDYVINNLINLQLNLQKGKTTYLHLDLSETDNDDLMNEILFKLLILRYLDSNEKIYYLGYDIHILIEIPNGFCEFDKKFKILNLFNKTYIKELMPLRLEENVKLLKDSNISIVAEVLSMYENGSIAKQNIDLESPIKKSAGECERIINKYFTVENQNYYQKMNFIKILAVQFTKFTKNPFLNLEFAMDPILIEKTRPKIIKNFIELTKVFTKSPFDNVLLRQVQAMEIFGNYDDAKMKEEEINVLADPKGKSQVFSFELIKPSLVFFNKDGGSISIISNNNKNDKEYQDLKELWNSQNNDVNKKQDLIDYKNMQHDKFVEQIKILFSLNTLSEQKIKDICVKLGNYIFVSDNFIKMVRILLNIEAKIPVILMGETGVGKTKLLEMLATLYGNGELHWKKLQIHAGTTDKKIIKFIEKVTKEVEEEGRQDEITWIFFDEINTCNSLGLITEIMCNHTYLGKKINKNFVFLGACNPYRVLTKKMRESGLVYYNLKEKNKLNNLVYTVNPLPHSLLNFIFDFGSLQAEDEKKYITNTIISIIDKMKKENIIGDIAEKDLTSIRNDIINTIVICHEFIREKYDKSSVSMREIRRFGIFLEYFIKNIDKSDVKRKMRLSLNMTLYLCYYLRLNDKKYRGELAEKLNRFFGDKFIRFPEKEIQNLTEQMNIEKEKGIALNRALKENLFTCFTCIDNTVPLIIVGKPGTGKSLSFQILYNTLKGEYSEKEIFKKKGKLYRYYYQGSETSTAKGIKQVFKKALNAKNRIKNKKKKLEEKKKDEEKKEENKEKKEENKEEKKEDNINEGDKNKEEKKDKDNKKQEEEKNKNINLVFFDEMGLAERSSNNPLKVIHYLLEKDIEDSVPFLGISNWRLDAAKINRALNLSITDYDNQDLEDTAEAIAQSLDSNLSGKYLYFFQALARTYKDYIEFRQNSQKEAKDFHGNRDFYNLIKTAMRELMTKKEELGKNYKKILTEIGIQSLHRNFGGLEDTDTKIFEFFKKQFKNKFDDTVNLNKSFSVLDAIEKNVTDPNSRYLMLISDGNNGSDIVKYLLKKLNKKYIELVGSKYSNDTKSGKYSEEILNKIKYIMETDNVLILRDLDIIYPSLYDLFNQNFTIMGEKKFARIAFEYAKVSSEVNKDFHVIVIVNREQIKKLALDPPFLNRFEKHIITYNMLLEEKDIEISKKIYNYLELISSFNNKKDLKIDLDKLLVNCREHEIQSLIFKIKNDLKIKEEPNVEEKEDVTIIEGSKYEEKIIREVFKKIVPTFCQDIIASMLHSGLPQQYNKFNEEVLEIYKKCKYDNFDSYFKNLPSKKNVIYTFSKVNENILEGDKQIKNKYGVFNSLNVLNVMSDSFKSNDYVIQKLQEFIEHEKYKLLTIRFTEKDLFIINSINYIITNFEKENPILKDKLIIFTIHKQRLPKGIELKKNPDLIPFINDEYNQIFIDNLEGKENSNILKIMEKKNEELAEEYINNKFIDNKIFTSLNYINYNIFYETKDLNKKNYTTKIAEKIINNEKVKELILKNLKKQGKSIKSVVKDIFVSDNMEVNDIDIFEVIGTKLSTYFCTYLVKIIFYAFKQNVLNQILCNEKYELIFQNEFFLNLINKVFDTTKFVFNPPFKMKINGNKIDIYNGFKIPKSKPHFDLIIKYVTNDIINRKKDSLVDVEQSLRKNLEGEQIDKARKDYTDKNKRFEENVKIELNKYDIFTAIFNQNNVELKILLLEDYLKYYIVNYSEKNNVHYLLNEKLLSFLKLIIKARLSESHNHRYEFNGSMMEFIKIILFSQVYINEIKCFLDIYIEINRYCQNIEDLMIKILEEEKIRYEISDRNKAYTEVVNINFFNIMEALIRAMLIYSIELIKKDKAKFFEYLYTLPSIEANLQKINKKFYLFSKELYNIRSIIKIDEAYKSNHEQFELNFEKIMNNLLKQSEQFYSENFEKIYNLILELLNIFDTTFKEKNEAYVNLLFFIFRSQYKNIYEEEYRIKLLTHFFQNKSLLIKSKIFLSETLKDLKPEVAGKKLKKSEDEVAKECINNFMNLENDKLKKYKALIDICKNINTPEFSEILLYFFEGQCQSYFATILQKYKNKYDLKCCENLLLKVSLAYLKKAIQYLYEHKDKNDNNLLKLFAIAYIKTYCYYYVDVNFNSKDNCNWKEINEVFVEKDEKNKKIRNMRNIYFWRLYCKKFENFEQFQGFNFADRDVAIYKELQEVLEKEKNNAKYIFKESFITSNPGEKYKKLAFDLEQNNELKFDEINENFDLYYCFYVNKIISYLYDGKEKNNIIKKMKSIYDSSYKKLKMGDEGKKLYNYLLDNKLYEEKIVKKISDKPLTQIEFEILLYSFRFIFNSQINDNKCFYNEILKKNTSNFINNNFIPGSFPLVNEYLKSYNILKEKLEKKLDMGYYICKDCGFLYEVKPCTFPMAQDKCPKGHTIGGLDHKCSKPDIRVFYDKAEYDKLCNYWRHPDWVGTFVHNTIDEFKVNYVDKNIIKPEKGIIKDFEINEFERNSDIRDMNIITFRILNFILYSYILGSYILDNIKKNEVSAYLVENLFPHTLFGIMIKNWEMLDALLKEKGVENIQVFMNMIFEKMNEFICNLKTVDTVDKLTSFEKKVNDYIMGILSNKANIDNLNQNYQKVNSELLVFNPNSIKEIILGNYEPSIYKQEDYPDIQYYTVSKIDNYDSFVNKFQSSKENESKYTLINLLLKKEEELSQNIICMKGLENLNKLTNMLISVYSFNISRDDGKKLIFKKEIDNIIDKYNEMNKNAILNSPEEFEKEYVQPFIQSWDKIKKKCVQYKCRILRENEKQQYLDMNTDLPVCFFLVDDGDIDGGMFLASAYQHMIDWQNALLNLIISKNNMNGILNSYVSQLEQEINIQEATKDEIIKIDDKTYKELEGLISSSAVRNIFTKGKDNNIQYKNYNDIIYNYDYIEEELGKIILPGLKRFKPGVIKFVTYLYEGFRGDGNSSILTIYNSKYIQKPLSEEEKEFLGELLKINSMKIFNEVFSSLQILMNEIIKENYPQDILIYDIIEKLPNYIVLNKELKDLLKRSKELYMNEKVFTINSLVSVFEYFEALCWPEISKNILEDYTLVLSEASKKHVLDYFKKNENEKKIINVQAFTFALRRLISRYVAGSRQEIDINGTLELKLHIGKNEFWSKEIGDNDEKDNELYEICHDDIKIGNAWDLYNLLDGDTILNKIIDLNKKKEKEKEQKEVKKNDEFEVINTEETQADEQKVGGIAGNIDNEEKEEEEEEEEKERDDF